MAGVFGLALMGGVMLSSQEVDAQITINVPEIDASGGNRIPCASSFGPGAAQEFVVACDTCRRTPGKTDGSMNGSCKPKKN